MHLKAIDNWSPIHWVCGFILMYIFIRLDIELIYVVFAILFWELLEYLWLGKMIFGRLGLNGEESEINIMSDILFGLVGAVFAYFVFVG